MKEISIFLRSEDISKVTDILLKNKAGLTFYEVSGTGRTPQQTPEIIDSYVTGRTTVPKFVKKTEVKTIVPDSSAKNIIDELLNSFGSASEPYGVMFVKEVSNAYELGTKNTGDNILLSK
jgi:nitrogen regulatory protein P-II 1